MFYYDTVEVSEKMTPALLVINYSGHNFTTNQSPQAKPIEQILGLRNTN